MKTKILKLRNLIVLVGNMKRDRKMNRNK